MNDNQHWDIAEQTLADLIRVSEQMGTLVAIDKQGQLSKDQQIELDSLSNSYNDLTLQRSESLCALADRGHDINTYLKKMKPKP